jgi:PBP1b-binding outer membrane lipoprotein LpoB
MKNKLTIFSISLVSALAFTACSSEHAAKPDVDSTGNYTATNPYRDTFKTTSTTGNATTLDNSGSGGTAIAKPNATSVKPDTAAAVAAAPEAK